MSWKYQVNDTQKLETIFTFWFDIELYKNSSKAWIEIFVLWNI